MSETIKHTKPIEQQARADGQQVVPLPLTDLHPSKTNRPERSGFDDKSIAELAESIRGPGIIEPLIVRPRAQGGHEIVCGERRWTAAKLIKLQTAPCIVRQLDDSEARKIQIIENLQREGLHPVEEAKGYADLLAQKDAQGKSLNTIESIAKDIGKSAAFVYSRLTLLKMPKLALEASLTGRLSASNALLIARIPDPKQAYKATMEVLDPFGQGEQPEREKAALNEETEPMSYRRAKQHIQEHYMIRLKGAPFDQEDAELVPAEMAEGQRVFGKCSECLLRTGNMKALFPDVDSLDVCTNTECFKKKKDAAWRKANEKAKAQGHTLLRDSKARQMFQNGELVDWQQEYVDVRGIFPGDRKKTWEQVLGEHLPDNLVQARDDKRKVHFLLPMDAAAEAAKKAGKPLPKEFTGNGNGNGHHRPDPEEQRRQEEARKKKIERAHAIAQELGKLVVAKAEAPPTNAWWRWMLTRLFDGREHVWAQRFGCKSNEELAKLVDKAGEGKCRAMMVAIVGLGDMVDWQGEFTADLLETCEFYKIDHKKAIAAKQAEFKAEDKAVEKSASAKPKSETANAEVTKN